MAGKDLLDDTDIGSNNSGVDLLADEPAYKKGPSLSDELNKIEDELGSIENKLIPNLDYYNPDRPIDTFTRFQMGRQDKPSETEKYLDSKFGRGNWAKIDNRYVLNADKAKEYGIKSPNNLPVAINPWGLDTGDIDEFMGDIAGPTLGGIAAGIATGGAGFIPGVIAAGAGSAGGEALDEGIKVLEGTSSKSAKEIAQDVATEGILGATGEGVFRLATPFLSKTLGPHTKRATAIFRKRQPLQSTVEPERLSLLHDALDAGYRPHVSVATGKNLAGRMQSAAEFIFGQGKREAINQEAMIRARNKLTTSVGSQPKTAQDLIAMDAGNQLANASDTVLDRVNTVLTANADEMIQLDAVANSTQRRLYNDIQKSFAFPDNNLGEKIQKDLVEARRAYYEQSATAMRNFDEIVQHNEFDSATIQGLAKDYLERGIFKTNPIVGRQYLQAGNEESIAFLSQLRDMDRLQSGEALLSLRQALKANVKSDGGLPSEIRSQLIDAVDYSLRNGSNYFQKTKKAQGYLDKYLSWDDSMSKKFDTFEVNSLIADPSKSSNISADKVVSYITDMDDPAAILKLKEVIKNPNWRKIQRGVFDDIVSRSSSPNGSIDASNFYKYVNEHEQTLKAIYGDDKSKQISTYSKFLAARDGIIPLDSLNKGDPYTVLRDAVAKRQSIDQFVSETKDVSKLITNSKYSLSDIIPSLMQDSGRSKIKQLKTLVGENSQAWTEFRSATMEKILQPLVKKSDDAVDAILDPKRLDEMLAKYSPSALTEIFGPETTTELYKFAKVARYAVSKKSPFSGSIVAASIALHPLGNLGALAKFKAVQSLMSTPGFLKYMSDGLSGSSTARMSLREINRMANQLVLRTDQAFKPEDENVGN